MKTALKVALGLLAVLALGSGGTYLWVRSRMAPPQGARVDVEPVATGVQVGFAYAWIVKTPNGAFLVDAGLDPAGEEILAELKVQGVPPEAVHAVLLTHGHPDHWAAAARFPKAKVMVGQGDVGEIRSGPPSSVNPLKLLGRLLSGPRAPVPANLAELKGGETLDLDGVEVKAISIPGHTAGSMAYLVSGVLFTGDSLAAQPDGSLGLLPGMFAEDLEQNRRSLEKLRELDFGRVADGHAGVTVDARTRLEIFLSSQGAGGSR